jgi:hypothetical protein
MDEKFLIRDVFNPGVIRDFAKKIKAHWPAFGEAGFLDDVLPNLGSLTYSERSALMTDALRKFLPPEFPAAVEILLACLPPEMGDAEIAGFDRFIVLPQTVFVGRYGLDHYEISMRALYEMTKRFTAGAAAQMVGRSQPARAAAGVGRYAPAITLGAPPAYIRTQSPAGNRTAGKTA